MKLAVLQYHFPEYGQLEALNVQDQQVDRRVAHRAQQAVQREALHLEAYGELDR